MGDYLGKDIKKLGFGFMRLPQHPETGEIDIEASKEMVDFYLESGYTYFDTAVPYHGQKSESALKLALTDRYPRESYQIATKMSNGFVGEGETAVDLLYKSLETLGVDYVDFYLLHAMNSKLAEEFDEKGVWEMLLAEKAKGKIKHLGLSFHDKAEVLDQILTAHPEAEFVQLQLNYADWENENIQSRLCYEVALKHKKPIIVMEPIRGGMLSSLPQEATKAFQTARPEDSMAKWALRFCNNLDNVITILSGMSNLEQMKENVHTFDTMEAFTERDKATIEEVCNILDAMPNIPCTDCKYCVKDCPAEINIPRYFSVMNVHLRHDGEESAPCNRWNFNVITEKGGGKPSACVACKKCEEICPQGIEIVKELQRVGKAYETK